MVEDCSGVGSECLRKSETYCFEGGRKWEGTSEGEARRTEWWEREGEWGKEKKEERKREKKERAQQLLRLNVSYRNGMAVVFNLMICFRESYRNQLFLNILNNF